MRTLLAAAIVIFSAHLGFSQKMTFTVDLQHTDSKEVMVTLHPIGFHSPKASYQMPVWAPGAYSVTNYGRFVKNFIARDKSGKEIPTVKINENRWEMKNAANLETISYSVINSYKDSTSLYFAMCHIDTNFFFANATALFGYFNDNKSASSQVDYLLPTEWTAFTADNTSEGSVITPASQTAPKQLEFRAANYDELADAPVMAGKDIQFRTFTQGGAAYDIAVASDEPFPMDSLAEYTKKIVKAETDFFGDTPFKRYTFLINAPTFAHSPVQGFGALEHANSSDYLLINMNWSYFKVFALSTISHEFFHLWNVKRIHSNKLGPFDYTKRVETTSLWLSEGVTDYYANTLLTRTGIFKPSYFEHKIDEWCDESKDATSTSSETLEQLSIDESDFDLSKAMSFYTKGPLVALMLDIEIRTKTKNAKSLDDVMHSLYTDAKNGIHFKDEELIGRIELITGLDLQDFYNRYIAGSNAVQLDSYLKRIGVGKIDTTGNSKQSFYAGDNFLSHLMPTKFEVQAGDELAFVFYNISADSALINAGVQLNDTLISVDGKIFTLSLMGELGMNFNPPVSYRIEVARALGRKELQLVYNKPRTNVSQSSSITKHGDLKYEPLPNVTPSESALRAQIYGR